MKFNSSPLFEVKNRKYLSELLHIELYKLKNIKEYFKTTPFLKTTSKGKVRYLYNPSREHKYALKTINRLLQRIDVPDFIYGGIKSKDYVMNARFHRSKKFFLLLDLKDFFPSTREIYVYNFFKSKLNMPTDIAKICTNLVTENHPARNDRYLPQGYSTSPLLSYLCYHEMFDDLKMLAKENNIDFTCYYDDITFSSSFMISRKFKNAVINIIDRYGLEVNSGKTKLRTNNKAIRITGTILKDGSLFAPNKLQYKMMEHFNQLLGVVDKDPSKKKEILRLCNVVQGCCSAIKFVENGRNFPSINNSIKGIRGKYVKS